jgi:prephenate dehydrogenase
MCGKESSGLEAAEVNLFQDAPWIICPLPRTPVTATNLVRELALKLGACPLEMEAERHDRLVAAISHLPYGLAACLVLAVADLAVQDAQVWELAASGFRDTTRIAASDLTMVTDILLTNRRAVVDALTRASGHLRHLADLIDAGDEEGLRDMLSPAYIQRKSMFRD